MGKKPTVRFKKLHKMAQIPVRGSEKASGLDLFALETGYLQRGEVSGLVRTGISMALPPGFEAQVRPRSGLALKKGVTVLNSPGTVDEDYRGEVCVILVNHGAYPYFWKAGERIAQLVIQRVPQYDIEVVEELDDTDRGDGGFGSTGR